MFLVNGDNGYFHNHLKASEGLYWPLQYRGPVQRLPAATVKMRLAMAIEDWAYPNSPFRANVLKHVQRNISLDRSSSDSDTSRNLLSESVKSAASKAGLLKNTIDKDYERRSIDTWPDFINESYKVKQAYRHLLKKEKAESLKIELAERARAEREESERERVAHEERVSKEQETQKEREERERDRVDQEERARLKRVAVTCGAKVLIPHIEEIFRDAALALYDLSRSLLSDIKKLGLSVGAAWYISIMSSTKAVVDMDTLCALLSSDMEAAFSCWVSDE